MSTSEGHSSSLGTRKVNKIRGDVLHLRRNVEKAAYIREDEVTARKPRGEKQPK